MKNRMISIGWMGFKTCYLNIPRGEAIRRYLVENGDMHSEEQLNKDGLIEEFEFDDEFVAYDVGPSYNQAS